MFNGAGVYRFKAGLYEGNFVESKFNGYGIKKYDNGESYIGNFKEDQFFGSGKYVEKDGTIYEGDFENGKLNGNGSKILPSKKYMKGTFKDWEPVAVKYFNANKQEITKLEFDAK